MSLSDEEKQAYAADAINLLKNPLLAQLLNKLEAGYFNVIRVSKFEDHQIRLEYTLRMQAIDDLRREIQKTIDNAKTQKEPEIKKPKPIH